MNIGFLGLVAKLSQICGVYNCVVLSCLAQCFSDENYTETIIRLRLGLSK